MLNMVFNIKQRVYIEGVCVYTVMRKTFEPSREEVTGDWGKLHREDLQDLYTSPYTCY
jgi:hypothetical protein